MKKIPGLALILCVIYISSSSCGNLQRISTKEADGGPGAPGFVLGKAAGNEALGLILGSTVGGVGGSVISDKMDLEATELKTSLPLAKIERIGEGILIEFNSKTMFGNNRYDLVAGAADNLDRLATLLMKYPDTNIEIQGHTDNKGAEAYNMKLSLRRASAVSKYLSSKQITGDRMHTKAFGETSPKYSNDEEDGRSQNRRVTVLIVANSKAIGEAKQASGK